MLPGLQDRFCNFDEGRVLASQGSACADFHHRGAAAEAKRSTPFMERKSSVQAFLGVDDTFWRASRKWMSLAQIQQITKRLLSRGIFQ
jgi:hypothetical protein